MQALLRAVVEARDPLEAEQHRQAQGHLVRRRIGVVESCGLIMVIKKADKIPAGLAVGTDQVFLRLFAVVEYLAHILHGNHAFGCARQGKK